MHDHHVHLTLDHGDWLYTADDFIRDAGRNGISSAYIFGDVRWPDMYASCNRWILEQAEYIRRNSGICVYPFFLLSPETTGQLFQENGSFSGVKLHMKYINFPYYREPRKHHVTSADVLNGEVLRLIKERRMPIICHTGHDEDFSNPNDILDIQEMHPDIEIILAHFCRFNRRAVERVAAAQNAYIDVSPMGTIPECLIQGLRFFPDYDDIPDVGGRMLAIASSLPSGKLLFGSDAPLFRVYGGTYEREVESYRKLMREAYGHA